MSKLKSTRSKVELVSLILAVVGLIIYCYFGVECKIMNAKIVCFLALGLVIMLVSILIENDWLPIAAEAVTTVGFMFFVKDSIASFVDWINGVTMFGGTGRMDLIFSGFGFILAAVLAGIISCFMKDKKNA